MNMELLNKFIDEKCEMIAEDLGIIVDLKYKEELKNELLNNLKIIANKNNIDINLILCNIDLIAGLDELIPYNDELADEFLLNNI